MTRAATRRTRVATLGLAISAMVGTALVGAPLALAGPGEHGTFDDQETYTDTLCGQDWQVTATRSGRYKVQADPNGTPFEVYHETRTFRLDHVNSTGDEYVVSGRINERLSSVEPLGGNVYRLTITQSGRTWSMYSASGVRVWSDRGTVITTFALDTLGDADPENDQFVEGSFDMSWHGPHFFSDTQPGSEYCMYVDQAVAIG